MNLCQYITDTDEPCGELCEGRTNFCASHNRMIRKQKTDETKSTLKRENLLKKPKKVYPKPNKVSPKRAELNKEYFKLVEQFKKDNPLCKAKVNELCTKTTDDPHHKRGRGTYLLDVSTWLPVCRNCHTYITDNHKVALEKGWSESRLAVNQETEPHRI